MGRRDKVRIQVKKINNAKRSFQQGLTLADAVTKVTIFFNFVTKKFMLVQNYDKFTL